MNYPADSFDAVIMSHVIEHVPQPRELLAECARLLKLGGRLVMLTPNAESFGLDYYGRCWRGLEPPRHLQIFSQPALETGRLEHHRRQEFGRTTGSLRKSCDQDGDTHEQRFGEAGPAGQSICKVFDLG